MGPDESYDPTEGNLPPTEFPPEEETVEQTAEDLGATEEDDDE